MKKLFLLLYLSLNLFALEKLNLQDESLPANAKERLESISHHAIKLGNGTTCEKYVFVDPMCPFSRAYIKKITQDIELQKVHTYYIFLYKLPKYESNKLSQLIYQSKNPLEILKDVMVKEQKVDLNLHIPNTNLQKKIDSISEVANELNVAIRPYIMRFDKGSNYCTVSTGTAPCTEEADFN